MVKLVVAYGAPDDPAAFDEHYSTTHAPLAEKIPNLLRFETGKVLGTPEGTAGRPPRPTSPTSPPAQRRS